MHGDRCPNCAGFSEAGGKRTDGALSRQRTRDQGVRHEGDVLNPWEWSKAERKFVPSGEFLKLHSDNAKNFFTPEDLRKSYPDLAVEIANPPVPDALEARPDGNEIIAQRRAFKNAVNAGNKKRKP